MALMVALVVGGGVFVGGTLYMVHVQHNKSPQVPFRAPAPRPIPTSAPPAPIDFSSSGRPIVSDLNGDGRMDVVLWDGGSYRALNGRDGHLLWKVGAHDPPSSWSFAWRSEGGIGLVDNRGTRLVDAGNGRILGSWDPIVAPARPCQDGFTKLVALDGNGAMRRFGGALPTPSPASSGSLRPTSPIPTAPSSNGGAAGTKPGLAEASCTEAPSDVAIRTWAKGLEELPLIDGAFVCSASDLGDNTPMEMLAPDCATRIGMTSTATFAPSMGIPVLGGGNLLIGEELLGERKDALLYVKAGKVVWKQTFGKASIGIHRFAFSPTQVAVLDGWDESRLVAVNIANGALKPEVALTPRNFWIASGGDRWFVVSKTRVIAYDSTDGRWLWTSLVGR